MRRLRALLVPALLLGACTVGSPAATPAPTPAPTAATCPVTAPTQGPPEAEGQLFGWASAHGKGDLWVGGLGSGGVIVAAPDQVEADGSIAMKLGWWRAVAGSLSIRGRRLDAAGPALRASVPDGYGETGFQSSGVIFPEPGCWEVTGRVADSTLTFVTRVELAG